METLVALLIGSIVTWITEKIKKHYVISSRLVLFLLMIIVAILYQIFVTFVPVDVQASVLQFVFGVLGTAVAVYEFVVRIGIKKEGMSLDITAKE